MRVAIYARVSTDRGEQNPDVQIDALRAFLAVKDGASVVGVYTDRCSGSKSERPALDELLAAARAGKLDAIAIVKLDRLARSTRHLLVLADELAGLGVDLIVKDQPVDTTSPVGKLIFSVLGAVAEFERDLICERTRAGVAHARANGARLGRPPVEFDEAHARGLVEWYGYAGAARRIGVPATTLRRRLGKVVA